MGTLDNAFVSGRTVEFTSVLDPQLIVVPRGIQYQGYTSETQHDGITWKVKYAYTGFNFFHKKYIFDGINEKGLYAGDLMFWGAKYNQSSPSTKQHSLASWQLSSYILANYSDVNDVKKHLHELSVLPVRLKEFNSYDPLHTKVTDKDGKTIVIEYIDGKLKISDDPLGVLTNAPSFDWQMTNLSNYPNLSNVSQTEVNLPHQTIKTHGIGYGLQGLPGDYSSPSRFVRAVFFTQYAKKDKHSKQAVMHAFHILNAFDFPYGMIKEPDVMSQKDYAYTVLTDVADQKNLKLYFRTYNNQDIQMISLKDQNLNASKIEVINLEGKTSVHNLSTKGAA